MYEPKNNDGKRDDGDDDNDVSHLFGIFLLARADESQVCRRRHGIIHGIGGVELLRRGLFFGGRRRLSLG